MGSVTCVLSEMGGVWGAEGSVVSGGDKRAETGSRKRMRERERRCAAGGGSWDSRETAFEKEKC